MFYPSLFICVCYVFTLACFKCVIHALSVCFFFLFLLLLFHYLYYYNYSSIYSLCYVYVLHLRFEQILLFVLTT